MAKLDNEELEGVLAHEMSHVAHKDVAVMTIASFLGIIAALMVRFAFYSELFGGGGRGRGGNNQNQSALLIFPIMIAEHVVYAVSFLLIRLLSRYRELSADRSGALLTGRPSALASALVKVTGDMGRIPVKDLRAAEPLNAFYFAPALTLPGQQPGHALLHPPVADRSGWMSWRRSPSSSASSTGRRPAGLARDAVQPALARRARHYPQEVPGGVPGHAARPDQAGAAEPGSSCSRCPARC